MKQSVSFLIAIIFLASCTARRPLLKKIPEGEKASVAIGDTVPSVCFFGADTAATYAAHKQAMRDVYEYFGPVYENFPIFDIGREKTVSYKNTSGTYVFYQPYAKGKTGIVISDGKSQPVICYSPGAYLDKIKTWLDIETADDIVPKAANELNEQSYRRKIEQIMRSEYKPDKKYADLLIRNANTVHYPKPPKNNDIVHCQKKVLRTYIDSSLQQEASFSYIYEYNDNNQMVFMETFVNDESQGTMRYNISNLGLIESIEGNAASGALAIRFVYLPDRYYVVTMQDNIPVDYETFFLNDKMQCIRRLSERADNSLIWDIRYEYDDKGRILKEVQQDQEIIYEYANASDEYFRSFSVYALNPRVLTTRNEMKREKNIQVFMGRDGNGKQTFRSVTITESNGGQKTYSYNAENELTIVNVSTCE